MQESVAHHPNGHDFGAGDNLGVHRKLHNVTMRWFANRRSRHTKTLEIMLANEVRTGLVHRIDIKRRATQMPRDRRNEHRTGRVRANVIVVFAPQRVKSSGKTERTFIDRRNRNRFIDQGIKRTLQPTERSRLELIFRHVKTYDLPSSMHARVGSSRANDGNVALIEHRENRLELPLHRLDVRFRLTGIPRKTRALIAERQRNRMGKSNGKSILHALRAHFRTRGSIGGTRDSRFSFSNMVALRHSELLSKSNRRSIPKKPAPTFQRSEVIHGRTRAS